MANNKNLDEINSLLSVLNHKIKNIDEKAVFKKKAHKISKPGKKTTKKSQSNANVENIQNIQNNWPEIPNFQTKIFKNPELIFKNFDENTNNANEIVENKNNNKLPKIEIKNTENSKKKIVDKFWSKKLDSQKVNPKENSLEDVENRIKDLHLKSENALMRFVEIRQDLIRVKGKWAE